MIRTFVLNTVNFNHKPMTRNIKIYDKISDIFLPIDSNG